LNPNPNNYRTVLPPKFPTLTQDPLFITSDPRTFSLRTYVAVYAPYSIRSTNAGVASTLSVFCLCFARCTVCASRSTESKSQDTRAIWVDTPVKKQNANVWDRRYFDPRPKPIQDHGSWQRPTTFVSSVLVTRKHTHVCMLASSSTQSSPPPWIPLLLHHSRAAFRQSISLRIDNATDYFVGSRRHTTIKRSSWLLRISSILLLVVVLATIGIRAFTVTSSGAGAVTAATLRQSLQVR
jgi:hypothetical protein